VGDESLPPICRDFLTCGSACYGAVMSATHDRERMVLRLVYFYVGLKDGFLHGPDALESRGLSGPLVFGLSGERPHMVRTYLVRRLYKESFQERD